ncbi:hypothetical protein AX16_008818 [Volvariella volvacea WC 439]|nr:hypothetical protein AX16_008818 [Volvariella volvacea WC 439]
MPLKRKRRPSPHARAPESAVSSNKLLVSRPGASLWGWVGSEVFTPDQITREHILATCGFSKARNYAFCPNKYRVARQSGHDDSGASEEDVIIVSDDDNPQCSKIKCRLNPNCLNYLGQEKWEDAGAWNALRPAYITWNSAAKARKAFIKVAALGEDPHGQSRVPQLPVGLKNLGATCYANASLQVWFRDLAFRKGVYACHVPITEDGKHKESPIFQLQVTFSALQAGALKVYNPTKLVESLQLRTSEQQDAQEFSKLFLSHLDSEFRKQQLPSLKSLIATQFEGKQVYGTECHDCHQRSEREAGFLELEVSFEDNAQLEACIESSLHTETLTGENQYHCLRCDKLRDATRYVELRELPPVLHFSLLRFVYNLSTMTRRKSKHTINFPTTLDMTRFVARGGPQKGISYMYELRGILLHKGSSAYHGHYEAQIFDTEAQSWFQFNDETVTKIDEPGDAQNSKSQEDDVKRSSSSKVNKNNKSKRRRIQDSDDEPERCRAPHARYIPSKDAYMLVYVRRDAINHDDTVNQPKLNVAPPPTALEVVEALNLEHDSLCKAYQQREQGAHQKFDALLGRVADIYRSWSLASSDEESIVVSQDALESWLSTHWLERAFGAQSEQESDTEKPEQGVVQIPVENLLCPHHLLDPARSSSMKRLHKSAYEAIKNDTRCTFVPELTPDDVCVECVKAMFQERLYEQEHPKLVREFDLVSNFPPEGEGYWISKSWLKDWKLARPKMHIISEGDPPPDSQLYGSHVRCEHGYLAPNPTQRRAITSEAASLLKSIFPSWVPVPMTVELCVICNDLNQVSREDRRELRKRADEEKGQLVSLYANASISHLTVPLNVPCAIIAIQFIKAWNKWLVRPTEVPRPERIDNDKLICAHDLLAYDPNHSSFSSSFMLIPQTDWDILSHVYPSPPKVLVEKRIDDEGHIRFSHDLGVCHECHCKRLYDWESTEITIRLWGTKNPLEASKEKSSQKQIITYSRKAGSRQSKRLRGVKELGERRKLTVSKAITLKDIKVMLQEELDVPTIHQKIFYQGQELTDNSVTMACLKIAANDTFDMQEEKEILDIDDDDDTDEAPTKRRREIERGFGGTLLVGTLDYIPPPTSSRDVSVSAESIPGDDVGVACPTCTYLNPDMTATACAMCYTKF